MLTNSVSTWKIQYGPVAQDLQEKTILVIGNGNGGGRLTAEQLASCGAKVFLIASSREALSQALEGIRQNGGECDGLATEIRSAEDAEQLFAEAERRYGPIHAVVDYLPLDRTALAGESGGVEDIEIAVTQAALAHLQSAKHGQIINIGQSRSGPEIRLLAAALRRQAKELGIRVTLVEPGETQDANVEDIVQCVMRSLIQPFGVDVIFLQGEQQD